MYGIGIVGHTPEVFSNADSIRYRVEDTLNTLSFQYGSELVYNISVDIGVGLWAAEHCFLTGKKYHLFLPFMPEVLSKHWYKEQVDILNNVYKYSNAISIIKPVEKETKGLFDNTANEHIVKNSNFTMVFWDGRKQGNTYETIKYSFDNNRMVIDGCSLRIITEQDTMRK